MSLDLLWILVAPSEVLPDVWLLNVKTITCILRTRIILMLYKYEIPPYAIGRYNEWSNFQRLLYEVTGPKKNMSPNQTTALYHYRIKRCGMIVTRQYQFIVLDTFNLTKCHLILHSQERDKIQLIVNALWFCRRVAPDRTGYCFHVW